jgi:hypothetical protein
MMNEPDKINNHEDADSQTSDDDDESPIPIHTRSGRQVKKPVRYIQWNR